LLIFNDEILEVDTSSDVVLRYPTASEDTLIMSPVSVEKNPVLIVNVDMTALETYSFSILLDVTLKRYPFM
jgi:hypothetical protein